MSLWPFFTQIPSAKAKGAFETEQRTKALHKSLAKNTFAKTEIRLSLIHLYISLLLTFACAQVTGKAKIKVISERSVKKLARERSHFQLKRASEKREREREMRLIEH